ASGWDAFASRPRVAFSWAVAAPIKHISASGKKYFVFMLTLVVKCGGRAKRRHRFGSFRTRKSKAPSPLRSAGALQITIHFARCRANESTPRTFARHRPPAER